MSEAILIMDPEKNICAANKKALEEFPSFNTVNSFDCVCHQFIFGTKQECKNCPVTTAIKTGKSCMGIINPKENEIWRVTADPVFKDQQLDFIIKKIETVKDLSDIEKKLSSLNSELRRSNHDLELFAYAVSHDLREPLRMVASYLQLIDMENGDKFDAESKEFMSIAFDGAKRMNDLLDGLLQYSRVGTNGKLPIECDCNDIVKDAQNNLMLQIEETNTAITTENLPGTINVDKSQLIQLFSNLISNSIKYAKPDTSPEIKVSCVEDTDNWCFCVSDNGMGIEAQYYDRIFQVFQRLHDRTSIQGYGLGLSICKRIVERHSGRIWVESDNNEGSKFFFNLPKKATINGNQD